jgi:hypothetical protein
MDLILLPIDSQDLFFSNQQERICHLYDMLLAPALPYHSWLMIEGYSTSKHYCTVDQTNFYQTVHIDPLGLPTPFH